MSARHAAAVALLGLVSCLAVACGTDRATTAPPTAGPPAAGPVAAEAGATAPDAGHRPVRVRIPAIGVDAAVVDIGVDAAGALVPPGSTTITGWFAAGPAPGDDGPALIAAHVDSRAGPGVFFRLRDLRTGDVVEVDRADGGVASFTVDGQTRAAKSAFPTDLVYAPTPGPELRLVTCGGPFDRAAGSYLDNVIVEAVPTTAAGWRVD